MCCQILKIFIILIRIKQLNSVFALIFLKNTINSHSKKKKKFSFSFNWKGSNIYWAIITYSSTVPFTLHDYDN